MLWFFLTVLAVIGAAAAFSKRRRYESVDEEPWRASLQDEEPLDMDEIRRAEEEFLADEWSNDDDYEADSESWR